MHERLISRGTRCLSNFQATGLSSKRAPLRFQKGLIRSFLEDGSFKDSYKALIRVPGGFEEGRASLTALERKSSQSLEAYSVMNMTTYSPYVMETYPI